MATIPSNLARVSSNLVTNLMTGNLQRTNLQMLKLQEQLSTGLRVNRPSDDASVVGSLTLLQRTLGRYEQQQTNLGRAQTTVDNTDQALADVSNLLLEAQNIASDQVGVGSTAETRANQAQVIDAMITSLMGIANRSVRGVHLFAGETADTQPFVDAMGGVRYTGSRQDLQADLGLLSDLGVNLNGVDAFGAMSSRVQGSVDLDPAATADTRLAHVNGGRGRGVTLGTINLDVDGTDVSVDLVGADTLGDIVTRLNDAITSVDPAAGSVGLYSDGLALTANAGHTITISDIGTGITAADLGIDLAATAATVNGADLDPRVTALTAVASFGPAVDTASGLKVTNGATTQVIDLSTATTVQDMINRVAAADVGVRMEINADGTGLNLVNEVSGLNLSVGENAGGSTATDLGLRSMAAGTKLSELNFGRGVATTSGADMRLHLHDGSDIDVDLTGAATVGDVIAAINAAAGGSATASLAADGNGLVVTDNTAGGDAFGISAINGSTAAGDLGVRVNAGAGHVVAGADVAQVRTESVFTHLMMLRQGLRASDEKLITEAGSALHEDVASVASARAQMGVRGQRLQQQSVRLEERTLQTRSLLSDLRDADYNQVISRFVQYQQQLQANLLSGQQMMSLSLLDFLR